MARVGWCETCRWWGGERAHDNNMPVGTCHAEVPRLTHAQVLAYRDPDRPEATGPLVQRGEWPWTAFDDWCARHDPKPEEFTDETRF